MRAFEVSLNGRKLCRAGIEADGVLSAIVSSVITQQREDLRLEVGGLISATGEHALWAQKQTLRSGDRIQIKVVDAAGVDEPVRKYRPDPKADLKAQKRYVRMMARKFGWEIQSRPRPSAH